jgi:polysaccharide deacetylase 2 family uncharacterized protein YibQ
MGADVAKGVFSGVIWGAVVAGAGAGGLSLAYPEFKPSVAAIPASAIMAEAGMDEGTSGSAGVSASDSARESASMDGTAAVEADAAQTDAPMSDAPMSGATTGEMSDAMTGDAVAETTADTETMSSDVAMSDDDAMTNEPQPDAEVATIDQPMAETSGTMEPEMDAAAADPAPDETPGAMAASDTVDANADATENEQTEASAVEAGTISTGTISTGADTAQTEPDTALNAEPDTTADPATSITEEIVAALPRAIPQGTLGNLAEGVTTGRLPAVASGIDDDEGTAAAAQTPEPPKPITAFAETVDADDGRPLMSIVLIDEGDADLGLEALEAFPYPLTFAVDASAPDAGARMQRYRDKGFEVLALVSLPSGATPSDAEVAMSAYFSAVPEAVGILEDPGASLQESRELSDQVTEIIQNSGHGMVLQAKGLNTAQKLAKREGIPAASVFRDFDGKDQKAGVIRRFLDQAAFKAGQEGGVIMLGRLRGETISALLIWGLADRASRAALVPVSAVLTQSSDDN